MPVEAIECDYRDIPRCQDIAEESFTSSGVIARLLKDLGTVRDSR